MEYKIFAKNVGIIGITNILIVLIRLFLVPILTKNIPIDEYGLWVQINTTISLVVPIIILGLPYAIVRFINISQTKEKIQEEFYSILIIIIITSTISSLIIYLLSDKLAPILFNNNLIVTKLLSIIIFIQCINDLSINLFRVLEKIKTYSIIIMSEMLFTVILSSYFVLSGYGIFGATLGLLISKFFIFLIIQFLIFIEVGIKIPRFENIPDYLKFSLPTIPGFFSNWIINSSDRYLITLFLGISFAGYYSPGYILGNTIYLFVAPFSFMLPSVLSKYYEENNFDNIKKLLEYSMKYFMIISIPSAFGLSILSKPILTILSTTDIASNGHMITFYTAFGSLFYGLSGIICQILVIEKKTGIIGKIAIITAIINFSLNLVFIPYFGIDGAAITTLFAFIIYFLLITRYSFKYIKFDFNLILILKCIFASSIMSLMIIISNPVKIINIIYLVGFSVILYFAILFFIKGVTKKEIQYFKNLIKK